MRRFITAALLALFVCQSSGAAVAAPAAASNAPSLLGQIQFAFAQTLSSFQATQIGALLTGKEHQYEAMHAAPPDFSFKRPELPSLNRFPRGSQPFPTRKTNGPAIALVGPPMLRRPLTRDLLNPAVHAKPSISVFRGSARPKNVVTSKALVQIGTPSSTGINRWWTYEETSTPGVGRAMVNVANGNLLIQETDIDVPERGIDLAFRRTYNSLSGEDYAQTDGSAQPAAYGPGWTNTFDAHIATNSSGGYSIFDIDGARYDFTPNGQGGFNSPPGMEGTSLRFDGSCGYQWFKKNGTVYYFYQPVMANCGHPELAAYGGRLYEIWARNWNNFLLFTYSWDNGDATNSQNLNQIAVRHSDGQQLTLVFSTISGHRVLQYIIRPGQSTIVWYNYDSSANFAAAVLPPPGPIADTPGNPGHNLQHDYIYAAGTHRITVVDSPIWHYQQPNAGCVLNFVYDGSGRATQTYFTGVLNFAPGDGTGANLQGGATGDVNYGVTNYTYGSGETQLADSDGHATNWFYDGSGRTTETQEWTGAPNNLWLTTYASWDGSNNLTETVDARGNATDYGYDGNGNTIWTQAPWITTSMGYGRPVARYSYDQFNNLVAYCDPQYIWTTGATSCNAGSGVTHYTWNYSDSNEPYGYLTDTYTPLGYHHAIAYGTGSEGGGDYGLPTSVEGDCIAQNDGTNRCPSMSLTYNAYGDVTQENTGNGTWNVSYDNLNRVTAATDPDGITSRTCYFQNNQISAKQTALQYSMDGGAVCGAHSSTFSYDADGNEISETNHINNTADTTSKWYDGADRLVEVRLPYDASDAFQNPWITRYIYDLTQGGTVTLGGASSVSYRAYGNLYKTQELLMPGTSQSLSWYRGQAKLANTTFQDTKGTAFDALDRPLTKYQFVNDVPQGENETYDQNGYYGEATGHCNSASPQQCAGMTYYTTGALDQVTYNDATPSETSTYDPDGRLATQASGAFGTQSYAYDADGRLTSEVEPSGGGVTSPATLTHHYYADGMRAALDVASSALNQGSLFAYAYRTDGKLQTQQINYGADAKVGSSAVHFTYTNAGKLTQRTESGPAANPNAITFQYDGSTGVMTSANYPAAALSGFAYDAEGQIQTFNQNIYGYTSGSVSVGTFTRTVRGELTKDPRATAGSAFANGAAITGSTSSATSTWDARSGRSIFVGSSYLNSNGTNNGVGFSYDAAGRQIDSDQTGIDHYENQYDITNGRTYDAENHVISASQYSPNTYQSRNYYTTRTAYDWGPNGHPIRVGSTPQLYDAQASTAQLAYDTLHWDGNQLLFTTNSAGQVDDIKVGTIGDITPLDTGYSGLTFYDRVAGSIAFCHNATGARGRDYAPASHSLITGVTDTSSPCASGAAGMSAPTSIIYWGDARLAGGIGQGKVLGMAGPDGIDDGVNIIQGVRNYDPLQGQWTTPDAYAGDTDDPATQKSYLWNHGSPESFVDSTGFDAFEVDINVAIDQLAASVSVDDGQALAQSEQQTASNETSDVYVSGALPTIASVVSHEKLKISPMLDQALAASAVARTTTVYLATNTLSGKPYVGITYDDRFMRRAAEQLKNGRIIRPIVRGLSRLAARGAEQTAIRTAGLQNLENQINSIGESGAASDAAAAAEEESPGVLEQIVTAIQNAVEGSGGILP